MHYMTEAYIILNRDYEIQETFKELKKETDSIK